MGKLQNTEKSWKDVLLSSGLPLEHSVRQMFKNNKLHIYGEYSYERTSESGITKFFSIDLRSTAVYAKELGEDTDFVVNLDLLVECKFRHDNVKWVFTPKDDFHFFDTDFVILDQWSDRKVRGIIDPAFDQYVGKAFISQAGLCDSGVELIGNNSDRTGIREGIFQLKYATAAAMAEVLRGQVDYCQSNMAIRPSVLMPILITTAELWRLKPTASLVDIRSAKNIEEVAVRKESILYHQEIDRELRHTVSGSITNILDGLTEDERVLLEHKARHHGVEMLGWEYPSCFYIINYANLQEELSRLISFFTEIAQDILPGSEFLAARR